jgi:hypothetical protein
MLTNPALGQKHPMIFLKVNDAIALVAPHQGGKKDLLKG